jgi:diguanylate cyclase (GGDEF)-like protein
MLFSELSTMAKTDPLTGLLNRREFENQGSSEMQRCKRYNRGVAILMLDLDFFKSVNDSYGHAAGDSVLKALSANLKASLRMADIACRYGGEEFVVLAPETTLKGAAELAERIRSRMETTFVSVGDDMITITVSIGIAETAGRTVALETLTDEADKALYAAKSGGRNAVFAWNGDEGKADKMSAGKNISLPI